MTSKHVLLGLLIVAVFATGFMMGRFSVGGVTAVMSTPTDISKNLASPNGTTEGTITTAASGTQTTTEGSTKVNTSSLSEGQKTMLRALGVDVDTLVVTPAMIACAETSVGTARALEIKNGATPSMIEGAKLVACYK